MKRAQHLASTLQSQWRKLPLSAKLRHPTVTDAAISLTIALILWWLYSPFLSQQFGPYDTGLAAYGAVRVLDGFIPYVEMHTPYGPGQYYIRALLFYLFGTNIRVMSTEWVTVGISFVVVSYWVLRSCTGRVTAVLLTLVVAMLVPVAILQHGVGFLAMLVSIG